MAQALTQRTHTAGKVANLETDIRRPVARVTGISAELATQGEMFRRVRVTLNAAQRDVAEASCISHTFLGEVENGLSDPGVHRDRIKRALLRIASERAKAIARAIEELAA